VAFRLALLQRRKAGGYKARKVIPADVRAEYRDHFGKSREEIFNAPATDSLPLAKRKHSDWLSEIEGRIETLRAKKRGEGRDLTQREAQALAGQWYLWFVGRHQEDPGDAWDWHQRADLMMDAVMGATPKWNAHDPFIDQSKRAKEPAVREDVHPVLADEAKTAQFLASKGEVLKPAAMVAFLDCILDHYIQACALLERRARGDYTPDALPRSFPEFDRKKPKATSGLTGMQLFEAYIPAADLAAGTVRRWRTVFNALDAHLDGRSVDSLSEDEAQQFVASLVTKKRNPFTVMNTYVASLRAVCAWAVKHQRSITVNSFTKAGVKVPEHHSAPFWQ
jgi:hypothetical protein